MSQLALESFVDRDAVDARLEAWKAYLTGPRKPVEEPVAQHKVVDLFSGVGGLALGYAEAARELAVSAGSLGAVDVDSGAIEVYRRNFGTEHAVAQSVASLVDFQVRGEGPSARFLYEPELVGAASDVLRGADVVLAGPPCQGNSSLNNRTRGDDPRNRLYLAVPAVAVASRAHTVLIENVPGVVQSRGNIVDTAITLLKRSGYAVTTGRLAADALGWPQTRKRFFLVATRNREPVPLNEVAARLKADPMPVAWAIDDLINVVDPRDPMYAVADLSRENADRIAWLFANGEYDMPNHLRPDCHKEGTSYGAVYGRMRWDRPAPTLTTGFLTPGRGRFVHPRRPRTLTPREAARIQGFPDWFEFRRDRVTTSKRDLVKWIGNAVPPILGYAAGLSALGPAGAE